MLLCKFTEEANQMGQQLQTSSVLDSMGLGRFGSTSNWRASGSSVAAMGGSRPFLAVRAKTASRLLLDSHLQEQVSAMVRLLRYHRTTSTRVSQFYKQNSVLIHMFPMYFLQPLLQLTALRLTARWFWSEYSTPLPPFPTPIYSS